MKKLFTNLLVLLIALGLTLVAAEITLRSLSLRIDYRVVDVAAKKTYHALEEPASSFVYRGGLGFPIEFEVPVKTNSLSFRDSDYQFFAKPPGIFRILVLGDSFTEAVQVPLEKTFPKLLEQKLNAQLPLPGIKKYEVLALARSGAGQNWMFFIYEKLGQQWQADLVMTTFFSTNDVEENSPTLARKQRAWNKLYADSAQAPWLDIYPRLVLFPGSQLNRFLAFKITQLISNHNYKKAFRQAAMPLLPIYYNVYRKNIDPEWDKGWRATRDYLVKIQEIAHARGAGFLLVSLGSPFVYEPNKKREFEKQYELDNLAEWDFHQPEKLVFNLCVKNQIAFMSLTNQLQSYVKNTGKSMHWRYDMHWNEYGHQAAAAGLFEYLQQQRIVEKILAKKLI